MNLPDPELVISLDRAFIIMVWFRGYDRNQFVQFMEDEPLMRHVVHRRVRKGICATATITQIVTFDARKI